MSRSIGTVANSVAWKEICFILRKVDFDLVRAIVNDPSCAPHVTTLAYVVEVLNLERQTLDMFRTAARRDEHSDAHLHTVNPRLFDAPGPAATEAEIRENYARYLRLYEEQSEILANDRDFAFVEEVIAKLPNLRAIVMSDGNGLRIINQTKPVPRRDPMQLYTGPWNDGAASARHFRALLKGVEKAGTKLQSIQASLLHLSILDETQFGLHSMSPAILETVTTLQLAITAAEEDDVSGRRALDQDFRPQLEACRAATQKGALARILRGMPNLADLEIEFAELHAMPFGTLPSPAYLADVVPLDHTWPKLRRFAISNIETERQEILAFLARHKSSLESVDLGPARLTSTSWRKLLPDLKSQLGGGDRIRSIRILDTILGRSEDEFDFVEGWYLGHPDHSARSARLARTVARYLSSKRKKRCPLDDDNMLERLPGDEVDMMEPGSDDEWASSEFDEFEMSVQGDDEAALNAEFLNGIATEIMVLEGEQQEEEEGDDDDDEDDEDDEDDDEEEESEDEDESDSESQDDSEDGSDLSMD